MPCQGDRNLQPVLATEVLLIELLSLALQITENEFRSVEKRSKQKQANKQNKTTHTHTVTHAHSHTHIHTHTHTHTHTPNNNNKNNSVQALPWFWFSSSKLGFVPEWHATMAGVPVRLLCTHCRGQHFSRIAAVRYERPVLALPTLAAVVSLDRPKRPPEARVWASCDTTLWASLSGTLESML